MWEVMCPGGAYCLSRIPLPARAQSWIVQRSSVPTWILEILAGVCWKEGKEIGRVMPPPKPEFLDPPLADGDCRGL